MVTQKRNNPYVCVYTHKLIEALSCLDKPDARVLLALLAHVDELGICWPGVQRVADIIHHATATVEAALARLQRSGYIRIIIYTDPLKRKPQTLYMVSPHLHAVRVELEESAWDTWKHYENSITTGTPLINVVQPPPESESITTDRNHRQEPPPPPPPYSTPFLFPVKGGDQSAKKQKAAPNGAKSSGEAANLKSPAVPALPPLPENFDGKEPLPDVQDEAAAQSLHWAMGGLTLPNARAHIVRFGRNEVVAAANKALENPGARNPVGLMVHYLRQGQVDAVADRMTSGARIAATSDDFIHR